MPTGPLREPVKKLDGVLPPVHGRLDGIECSTATMPDAMPLAMAQPVAQEVGVSTRKRRPAISKARSGLASRKRNREALGFDEQLKQDVARLAKLARWSKRREDAPAPTAMAMTARANALSRAFAKIPPLDYWTKPHTTRQRQEGNGSSNSSAATKAS